MNRRPWSPDEERILESVYPQHGARRTSAALAEAGYSRSPRTVTRRACYLRVAREREATVRERILDVVRDYRGMPLSREDISAEVGLYRAPARALDDLVQRGVIAARPAPSGNGLLYFDPRADANP